MSEDLTLKDGSNKFDLDSEEGQTICKNFLGCVERFFTILQLKTCSKDYRT